MAAVETVVVGEWNAPQETVPASVKTTITEIAVLNATDLNETISGMWLKGLSKDTESGGKVGCIGCKLDCAAIG